MLQEKKPLGRSTLVYSPGSARGGDSRSAGRKNGKGEAFKGRGQFSLRPGERMGGRSHSPKKKRRNLREANRPEEKEKRGGGLLHFTQKKKR